MIETVHLDDGRIAFLTAEGATFLERFADPLTARGYRAYLVYVCNPLTLTVDQTWWALTINTLAEPDNVPARGTVRMVGQAEGALLLLSVLLREGQTAQFDLLTQTFDVAGNPLWPHQNLGVTATSRFVEIEPFDGGLVIAYVAADGMRLTEVGLPTNPQTFTAPTVFDTIDPQQVAVGGTFNLAMALLFADLDGDDLSFSVLRLPDGLRVDAETGQIYGQVAAGVGAGSYVLTLRADDDDDQPAEQSLTLTIIGAAIPTTRSDRLIGRATREVIRSLAGDDTVYAHGGNESVYGGGGNDRLFGDSGNDALLGGADNDTYVVASANDCAVVTITLVSTTDAGGIDTVQSAVSLSLSTDAAHDLSSG